MGGSPSKGHKEPITTTTTVPTTVPTTIPTTVLTPTENFRAAEVKCWINNLEILYMSLAFLSGILLTVLAFAIIFLYRKNFRRTHQNLQEEIFSQMAAEESARNTQSEVTYSTLVFQRDRAALSA